MTSSTPKTEALETLHEAIEMVGAPEPMTALRVRQVEATVGHAIACVERIQEVKRLRKPKKEART
jgi:hypothetical protein